MSVPSTRAPLKMRQWSRAGEGRLHPRARLRRAWSKPRALLAVLLLHANQVVSTDQLVNQLWGEAPPPTARNMVQVYVSRLRQALHQSRDPSASASVLATRPSGYLLR